MAKAKKPMSEEVKRRLAAASAARRGRNSLSGIDPLGWAGAIDTVLESTDRPAVELYASGRLITRHGAGVPWTTHFNGWDGTGVRCRWYGRRAEGERPDGVWCSWVRLSRTRPGLETDLERAFGCRWIRASFFAGPATGSVRRPTRIFRVPDVAAVFRVLWSETWPVMFQKYCVGCSPLVVERQGIEPPSDI